MRHKHLSTEVDIPKLIFDIRSVVKTFSTLIHFSISASTDIVVCLCICWCLVFDGRSTSFCCFILLCINEVSFHLCWSFYLRFGTAVAACIGGGTVYGNGNFAATAGFSNNILIALSCSDSMMILSLFDISCRNTVLRLSFRFEHQTRFSFQLFNWKRSDFSIYLIFSPL